ncbi:unnamed protein product [Microthlaspi erraticum]|uniref:Uncharacterized protein n=1 Tax=Microthlaspi erraticum TaxID=1685480 RepID=A0A6D2I1Y0_9BRAS|nr:unnamed protein product [Microthlaspi erraticum]
MKSSDSRGGLHGGEKTLPCTSFDRALSQPDKSSVAVSGFFFPKIANFSKFKRLGNAGFYPTYGSEGPPQTAGKQLQPLQRPPGTRLLQQDTPVSPGPLEDLKPSTIISHTASRIENC